MLFSLLNNLNDIISGCDALHNLLDSIFIRKWLKKLFWSIKTQQFMKEMVKIYFGLLKIQVKFLIN